MGLYGLKEVVKTCMFESKEATADQPPADPNQPSPLQRVEAASEFLSICDRLSTVYDSGYYWEDVQRALRIAVGIEKWPE